MIHKVESLDRVIAKVISDLGLGQDEIPFTDFVEWSADALEHIGAYYQFSEKEVLILIENYEGVLPCDFYKQVQLTDACDLTYSNIDSENSLYAGSLQALLEKAGVSYDDLNVQEQFIVSSRGLESITSYDQIVTKLQHNKNLIGNPTINKNTNKDFNINHNRITTAFQTGILRLQYLALPVDEKGWPMVPDNVSFRDALFWKIAYQISMRNPKLMANPIMQDMRYCKSQWDYYCTQARAAANMPDLDMTVRIKNNWLRLVNDPHFDRNNWRELGTQEVLNLNGKGRGRYGH